MRWGVLWLALLAPPSAAGDCAVEGRVVEIESGDTLLVEIPAGRIRVRLAGVRAPVDGQATFEPSRIDLVEAAYLRTACLRPLGARADGSLLATVRVGDTDLAARQLARGFAWFDPATDPADGLEASAGLAAERRVGVWARGVPESPWEWEQRIQRERQARQPTPTPSLVELAGTTRFADPKDRRIVIIASPTPTPMPEVSDLDGSSTLSLPELLEALGPLEPWPDARPTAVPTPAE